MPIRRLKAWSFRPGSPWATRPQNLTPSPSPAATATPAVRELAAERLAEVIESPTEVYADVVDLLVDGVAADQRQRLETIEKELEDVKKRLGRIWQIIETTDMEMADASERIREHRESKERLEVAEEEARGLLAERRQFLDSADTIATFAEEGVVFGV